MDFRRQDYMNQMRQRWTETYGNQESDALRWTWDEIGNILSQPTRYDLASAVAPIRVIPAETGVGKSTALRVFTILHSEQTNFLLACREIRDCEQLADDLTSMAREFQAAGLIHRLPTVGIWATGHRNPDSFGCDILVVTHEACRRCGCNPGQFARFNSGSEDSPAPDKPEFAKHNVRGRRWISDETYRLSDDIEFRIKDLERVGTTLIGLLTDTNRLSACATAVGTTPEVLSQELQLFESVVQHVCRWGEEPGEGFREDFGGDQEMIPNLLALLEHEDADSLLGQFDLNACVGTKKIIDASVFVVSNWAIRYSSDKGRGVITTVPVVPAAAPCLYLLDATANHSAALRCIATTGIFEVEYNRHLRRPDTPARVYSDVRLTPMLVDEGSKKAICENIGLESIASLANKSRMGLDRDSKVLFLSWKDATSKIKTYLRLGGCRLISVGHYNKHDRGTNEFHDHAAIVLVGVLRLPNHVYQSMVLAWAGPSPTEADHQRAVRLAQDLQNADMASTAIQAINRVRCRKVVNAQGGCQRVNVLLVATARTWKDLQGPISEAMPGIQIMISEDLPMSGSIRKRPRLYTKQDQVQEGLIRILRTSDVGTLHMQTVDSLLDRLGLPKGNARRVVKQAARDPGTRLFMALREAGYDLINGGCGRAPLTLSYQG